MKTADLHTHSYYSDGEQSPLELLKVAKAKGIKYLSLTDHNSVEGVEEAILEGKKMGIEVIPGVEVVVEGAEILGYFIDYKSPQLRKELLNFAANQNEKVIQIIKNFQKKGIDLSYKKFAQIYPQAEGNYNIGNLFNYFRSVKKLEGQEISKLIEENYPKNVQVKKKSILEGIALIKKYNGIPILAHPWIGVFTKHYKFDEKFVKLLVKDGLMGIEIDNGEGENSKKFCRTESLIRKIKKLAKEYDLILTSGSDYHGPSMKGLSGSHGLGEYNCDEKVVDELKRLI